MYELRDHRVGANIVRAMYIYLFSFIHAVFKLGAGGIRGHALENRPPHRKSSADASHTAGNSPLSDAVWAADLSLPHNYAL
jgi:hypothetical protein